MLGRPPEEILHRSYGEVFGGGALLPLRHLVARSAAGGRENFGAASHPGAERPTGDPDGHGRHAPRAGRRSAWASGGLGRCHRGGSGQQAMTWREVARRIAHEIRKPAYADSTVPRSGCERKFAEGAPDAAAVFDECTLTIIQEVEDCGTWWTSSPATPGCPHRVLARPICTRW